MMMEEDVVFTPETSMNFNLDVMSTENRGIRLEEPKTITEEVYKNL